MLKLHTLFSLVNKSGWLPGEEKGSSSAPKYFQSVRTVKPDQELDYNEFQIHIRKELKSHLYPKS